MEENNAPKIINDIVEFLNFWKNPDREEGEYISIKEFQLQVYSPSIDFVFKWYVSEEDLKAASEFSGIKIENKTIAFSFGEYNVELSVR